MKGSSVKINNIGLLQIFYPDYILREEITFSDYGKNIIYVGKQNKRALDTLKEYSKEYIIVGNPDKGKDFSSKEALLEWAYRVKGKEVPKYVKDAVEAMGDEEFEYNLKIYWLTGTWLTNEESNISTYELYQSSVRSLKDSLVTLFSLLEVYHPRVIEASYITFLSRVKYVEDQTVSNTYKKLLIAANNKYGHKITPFILSYSLRKGDPVLSLLHMVMNLR